MNKTPADVLKNAKCETSSLNGWYEITAKMAAILLAFNTNNFRTLSSSTVARYVYDMIHGRWHANGESIVFSSDGVLRNGQHRLKAIAKSGKTVKMYVIFDAEPTAFYDHGYKRSAVQILKAMGYSTTNLTTAIANMILNGGANKSKVGTDVNIEYVVENAEELKKVQKIISSKGAIGKKAACGAITYALLKNGEMQEEELTEFFRVVNSQNSAETTKDASPALVLSKQLSNQLKGGGSYTQSCQLECTYKALEDFHSNVTRKKNYTNDTHNAERLLRQIFETDAPIAA